MDHLIEILTTCVLATIVWFGSGVLIRWRCDRRLRRSTSGSGVLALTYDDGPGGKATPALLDLLARRGVHATFFLIGESAKRHPEIVDRIVAEGHTVFWHSRRHRNQWRTDPLRGFLDVWSTPMILRRGSASVHAFRPPYGKLTLGTVLACLARRWPVISWTHPSGDTCRELPEIGSFVDRIDRDQGGVILMHDMDRSEPERARFVIETTSRLIDLAEQRNWKLISSPNDWKRIT